MPVAILRTAIAHIAAGFPHTTPRIARRQAARLIRARVYLLDRGLSATAIGSKFEYHRTTGSVLGKGHAA